MNDQPSHSAEDVPQEEPQPTPEPQPGVTSSEPPAPATPRKQVTVTLDQRVAMVGAAAALVIVAGAVGFALGRTTADQGPEVPFPVGVFKQDMHGPNGWTPGQPLGPSWNNGQPQSGPGA